MTVKVGVLLPSSSFIPFIGKDFRRALLLGFSELQSAEIDLVVETTQHNAEKNALNGKIQDMLLKDEVDVVTAPFNLGNVMHVMPLFVNQEVPLIVNTLGEDIVAETILNPYLFVNSLNLWQLAWMSGYWGAATYGKRASSMSALHEGGYGMGFAFALGVEAQGGHVVQAAVTHLNSSTEDPSAQINDVVHNQPDFVTGFYAGKEARSFLKAYRQRTQIPLIASAFMLTDVFISEMEELSTGLSSIASWDEQSPEMKRFRNRFLSESGRLPNPYALLAYETGHLISKALMHNQTNIADGLRSAEINSPRGKIAFDPTTQTITTDVYLRKVVTRADATRYNQTIEKLSVPHLFYEQIVLARRNIPKQGWLNPYLVA